MIITKMPTITNIFLWGNFAVSIAENGAVIMPPINNPAIILADEPTGNLDSKSSEEIVELLKMTNKKYKQTIIMITHNLEIANQADRVLTIEDGKIIS